MGMTEFEREDWEYAFEGAIQRCETIALVHKASHCPICDAELGEPDFEGEDRSVGIFGVLWVNYCQEHGTFTVDELGEVEWEVEP